MYDSKRSTNKKKTRHEIEKDHTEKKMYEDCAIPNAEGLGSYVLPSVFAPFPFLDIDQVAYQNEAVFAGDQPVEFIESESAVMEGNTKILLKSYFPI